MKRTLLIVGGTLGGLSAVMAITPPQLNSSGNLAISGAGAIGGTATNSPTTTNSAQATPTQSAAKPVATKKSATQKATNKANATKKASASASATKNSNNGAARTSPTAVVTKTVAPTPAATPASKSVTGTFVGPAIFVNYGTVQVQITVKDGRITDATALQAPTGRNSRYTDMALPVLKKQTLAAQSANIQGASGASYTSYGWYTSLQGALAKAGI